MFKLHHARNIYYSRVNYLRKNLVYKRLVEAFVFRRYAPLLFQCHPPVPLTFRDSSFALYFIQKCKLHLKEGLEKNSLALVFQFLSAIHCNKDSFIKRHGSVIAWCIDNGWWKCVIKLLLSNTNSLFLFPWWKLWYRIQCRNTGIRNSINFVLLLHRDFYFIENNVRIFQHLIDRKVT